MQYVLLINSDKLEPLQLLAQDPAVHLSVLTKPKYAPLYQGWAEVWPVDDLEHLTQVRAAALEILRQHPIDTIVTPLERSLLPGAFLRSYLDLPGLSYDQMLRFANKLIMKRALRAARLPVPDFMRLDRLADLPRQAAVLGWPVVLKPAVGSGTMNTFKLDSLEQFFALLHSGALAGLERTPAPLLLERYVAMQAEYHCDGIVLDGKVVFVSVSRYSRPVLSTIGELFGSYILAEDDPALQPLRALHQEVVTALGLQAGVTHLEVFGTEQGFLVSEITCRPGGGGILGTIQRHYGVSLWEAFVGIALGNYALPDVQPRQGISGWCGLPGRNGLILAMTPPDELERLPGVLHVEPLYEVGDRIQEKITSVLFSGLVYFQLQQPGEFGSMLARVAEKYALRVAKD